MLPGYKALIDGWTLCNKPQNATVAPFDADAIGETKGPFHFNLADANSRYKALTAQRTVSNSEAKAPDSKSLRQELDALYAYITDVAFAHNVVNPTTELARYIRDVNDMIAEVNAAYNQRTGQTKAQTDSAPLPPPASPGTEPTDPPAEPDAEPDTTPANPDTGGGDDDNPYEDEDGGLAG